ncbi:virulence protein RhuM/Fic/DOC family protein [Candidatus Shapirobacteria bacterium]|nr:virulence protein RhuM/Fic/DOC family protein [Candidatus Shapirobacteria bacterium]
MKNKIVLYKSPNGNIDLRVSFDGKTVWLSQKQMAELFGKDVRTINEHTLKVFDDKELDRKSVIRKYRITAGDGKSYLTNFYNLDVVISVGYRVNSVQGTKFRIWATKILKNYLVKGYVVNKKRLLEQNHQLEMLKQSVGLITSKSKLPQLKGEIDSMLELISDYTNSIYLLTKYDEGKLTLGELSYKTGFELSYTMAIKFIESIKRNYEGKLTEFFGQMNGDKLKSVIGTIDQTFGGKYLYKSIEEKAANLLYLVIKDHPFIDGNKRIGSMLFVYYLNQNKLLLNTVGQKKINDRALVALALLIATSEPKEKDILVKLVVNLIK